MTELTESKILELKQAHGAKLCAIVIGEIECVFRKPRRVEYDRWYNKYSDGKDKSQASLELALSTLVFPSQAEFKAALDEEPAALTTRVDTEIIKLAGAAAAEGKARVL